MIRIITGSLNTEADTIKRFVYNHPLGNYFQSPSLYHLYLKTPNYTPLFLISYSQFDEINGLLLANVQREDGGVKGFFSSRCIIVGGPIAAGNDPRVADELVRALVEEVRDKSIYLEIRQLFVGDSFFEVLQSAGFSPTEYLNYVVGIDGVDENKARLNPTRRRQIGKAIKSGAEISVAHTLEEVREFYEILRSLYQSKVKKPLPPFELFENFLNDETSGKYFLVRHKGKTVGGIMCPIFKDTIYEWFVCGLDREYKELYPSVLATWAPIEYAAASGLKYFDFMGAGRVDEDYGVRDFKSKFGGELIAYQRFIKVNSRFLYGIGKAGLKLYSLFR